MLISDYVTHYHPVGDPPFRNLSELPEHQREPVISMLVERRRQNQGFHRIFGSKYIPLRLVTETKLRNMFIEAGGKPERLAPHYLSDEPVAKYLNQATAMEYLQSTNQVTLDHIRLRRAERQPVHFLECQNMARVRQHQLSLTRQRRSA